MPGPTWLANVHAALDRAVFAAYGWPEGIGGEDILKNLLALDPERSAHRGPRRPGGPGHEEHVGRIAAPALCPTRRRPRRMVGNCSSRPLGELRVKRQPLPNSSIGANP
jgi:hypothetical protein